MKKKKHKMMKPRLRTDTFSRPLIECHDAFTTTEAKIFIILRINHQTSAAGYIE